MSDLFQLRPGEFSWQPVLSGSMAPRFLPDDEIQIMIINPETEKEKLQPGTIAVFYKAGSFFFHRILFRKGKNIYEKGDGNKQGSWVCRKRIIGLVVGHRRMEDGIFISIPLIHFKKKDAYRIFISQRVKLNIFTRFLIRIARSTKQCISTILK